jgi:hypothetical protein
MTPTYCSSFGDFCNDMLKYIEFEQLDPRSKDTLENLKALIFHSHMFSFHLGYVFGVLSCLGLGFTNFPCLALDVGVYWLQAQC